MVIINRQKDLPHIYRKTQLVYLFNKLDYYKEMPILEFLNYIYETVFIYIVFENFSKAIYLKKFKSIIPLDIFFSLIEQ